MLLLLAADRRRIAPKMLLLLVRLAILTTWVRVVAKTVGTGVE